MAADRESAMGTGAVPPHAVEIKDHGTGVRIGAPPLIEVTEVAPDVIVQTAKTVTAGGVNVGYLLDGQSNFDDAARIHAAQRGLSAAVLVLARQEA
jgi:hypothetical protein